MSRHRMQPSLRRVQRSNRDQSNILYPREVLRLQSLFSLCRPGRTQYRFWGGVVDQLHQLRIGIEILSTDQ